MESANVIVTNRNAYVAVVLHEGVEGFYEEFSETVGRAFPDAY